jgi:hypothetical protein
MLPGWAATPDCGRHGVGRQGPSFRVVTAQGSTQITAASEAMGAGPHRQARLDDQTAPTSTDGVFGTRGPERRSFPWSFSIVVHK